ncbi:MAG: hypothetical protein ACRC4W_01965 [Treponemataceae bacterium]
MHFGHFVDENERPHIGQTSSSSDTSVWQKSHENLFVIYEQALQFPSQGFGVAGTDFVSGFLEDFSFT